jgi:hypothetical protein
MPSLQIVPEDASARRRIQHLTFRSSMREKAFEHVFLGALGIELLDRGLDYEVLHGEVDKDGYDVVLETGGIMRHVQLKVMIAGGARADVSVSTKLSAKPSACVLWLTWDPIARAFSAIRWFGDLPGRPLPDIGDKIAKHSRANAQGIKAERPGHRIVPTRRFETLTGFAELADRLFGELPQ